MGCWGHDTCHHTYEQGVRRDGAPAQQEGPVVLGVHQGGALHFRLPGLPSPMESLWSAQRSKVRLRKYFGDQCCADKPVGTSDGRQMVPPRAQCLLVSYDASEPAFTRRARVRAELV